MDGDELALTQEFLGIMLGVQRSGITIALGLLQAAAAVDQRRGYVIICDRPVGRHRGTSRRRHLAPIRLGSRFTQIG